MGFKSYLLERKKMNKKIITALLVTTSIMIAKPYAGLKLGFSKTQTNTKLSGLDADTNNNNAHLPFSSNQKMSINSMGFGLLMGTTFKINEKTSAFIEGDWEYLGGKTKKVNLDMLPDTPNNALARENVTVRAKNSLGFMPGVDFAFTEKVSGLFGLRFNMTQFHVRAFHINANGAQFTANEKSQSKFLFGVEPTLGAAFKINDKMAARLTVGYNFMQSKKNISDYMQYDSPGARAASPDVTIKPRGVNVRVAMTYSF